ncbi:MAG: ribbon-helix-helix protein, CopG family [Dehalococcoidia bacterium]|nr:ribbon-helix-helix protein, CopG family [Dehalococcoidia bacterium]
MQAERLEIRLDPERRHKLERLAADRGTPVSHLVRAMIDEAYERTISQERLKAALELGQLNIEDVPEPEELSKQLESAYDLPHLP